MILFKPEHVEPILEGRKTQTRRLGQKRWNVGAVHQCATRLFDPAAVFARVRIRDVRRETIAWVSFEDAQCEGYRDRAAFLDAWVRINGPVLIDTQVWVVEFEVAA